MSKSAKSAILIVFVLLLGFFAVTGYTSNPYTAEEIKADLPGCIADCYLDEGIAANAENISIIALCKNGKEMAFVFEKDGALSSGFAVKSLLLPRYQMACGKISASGLLEEQEDFDLTKKQEFILKDFFEEQTWTYESGAFTLESTEKKMNEEVKNGIIRAVCGVGIVVVTLVSKPKKEEEK